MIVYERFVQPADGVSFGSSNRRKRRVLGGPGSGNFGHSGRPGEIGGSGGGGDSSNNLLTGSIKDKSGKEYVVAWSNPVDEYGKVRNTYTVKDGKRTVGFAELSTKGDQVIAVQVSYRYQRKGIATALYEYIENDLGVDLVPNPIQTPEGKAFSKSRLRGLGGPGSGNYGHQGGIGGPGNPGGSSGSGGKGMTLADEKVPVGLRTQFMTDVEKATLAENIIVLRRTADRLEFPSDQVKIEAYKSSFVVGGRLFSEAGNYSDGVITINANTIARSSAVDAEVILTHEIMHRDWHDVATALELEMGPPSLVDVKDLPSTQTVLDILSEKSQILKDEDGVTDYSREYWREVPKMRNIVPYDDAEHPWLDNDTGELFKVRPEFDEEEFEDIYNEKYMKAINETLAEISTVRVRAAVKDEVSPTWREFHEAVRSMARELRRMEVSGAK